MGPQHGAWNAVRFASLIALCASTAAVAHDDDIRKLLDREPAVPGPIWSLDAQGTQRAGPYATSNITLLAQIPLNNFTGVNNASGNDCWGYVSPTGREYAIMGLEGGYGFVEITNPTNPVIIETISGPSSLWHDVKVLGHYAYGVSEGGSGIQIMDMSDIDNGNVTLVRNWTSGGYSTTHNIVANEESGTLWIVGANIGNGGLINIDISNPELPQFNGGWTEMYVHDAQVVNWNSGPLAGREIAFCAGGFSGGFSQTGLRIVDVTNPNNAQTLSTLFYPNSGYAHQVWITEDQKYLHLNDELDEGETVSVTTTRIINIEDPQNPFFVGTYTTGLPAVDHNLYIRDSVVYQANYRSGLRVFDAIDPVNPVEVAWIDTYPGSDSATFNGAWSSYPFFPSGNVIISDIERGLFIVRVDAELSPMALTSEGDLPSTVDPAGGQTLSAKPLIREGVIVDSVELWLDSGNGFSPISMSSNGDGTYSVSLPPVPCGDDIEYYFRAQTSEGFVATFPSDGDNDPLSANVVSTINVLFHDDFETNQGWSVSGNAADGQWERGIPVACNRGDPSSDYDGSGQAYLTDNSAANNCNSDVDDGSTILTSPVMDATGNSFISYARWFSNDVGANPMTDAFVVEVSDNAGGSWVNLETVGPTGSEVSGGWFHKQFDLNDVPGFVPNNQFRIRFIASDAIGNGSVVEAAVDAVRLSTFTCVPACPADINGDGELDFFDVSAFLSAFNAGDASADFNGDGDLDFFDISAFLGAFNAGCP